MTLEFAGNMLCSAGVSYFHVYPNGDVYRCLADYNARRPPMFNLKRDGWKGAVDPTTCDHERCYNACDLDWTTKWQVSTIRASWRRLTRASARTPRRTRWGASCGRSASRRPNAAWRTSSGHRHWRAITPAPTAVVRPARSGSRRTFPPRTPSSTVDEWTDIWCDILERFEYGILSITGGEPLLSDATIPVLSLVTQKFACYITSNISRNIMEFTRGHIRPGSSPSVVEGFAQAPIGLSGINCSLHPTSKGFNWELFKGSVLLLRNAGFHVSVNYVGYPLQLYLAPGTKRGATRTRSISRYRPGRVRTTKATSHATPSPSAPSSRRSRRRTARRGTSWCSWIAATK